MFSGKELGCETWNTKTAYFSINTWRDDETAISLTLWCLYTLVHVVIRVPVRRHRYWSPISVSSHPCLSLSCFVCSHSHVKILRLYLTAWPRLSSFINEELPHQHPLMPSASDLPEKSIQTETAGRKCGNTYITNTSTTNTSTKDKTKSNAYLIQKTINQPTANHSPIIMQQLHPHLSPSV